MSLETRNSVLVLARKSKFSEMDQALKSADIHWTECRYPSGDTPLHIAAQNGNIPLIRHLLEVLDSDKNNVDVTNLAGKTALHEACQNSQAEAVSYLLNIGAYVRAIKQADWTPLMLACTKTGRKALVCCQLLLENGGPVLLNDRNKDGWNALHIAVREGDTSIVKALLEADPLNDQALMCSNNGRTPLHTAALHGCEDVVHQLLRVSLVDCNAKDSCGTTPTHDAVRSGSLETLKAFISAGADLTVLNHEGYGVQHMAAQAGQVHILQHLMEELQGTIDNQLNLMKTTPLHCAVRAGQIKSVEFLLAMGADAKLMDSWDRSCYDLVPEKNSLQIKCILDKIHS